MQVETRDGGPERRILIGMIVDAGVLSKIHPVWKGEHFKSKWANIIGNWCIQYYNQYALAPGKDIQALFETWATDNEDKDTVAIVNKFLSGLSDEYQQLAADCNTAYITDLAAKHFTKTAIVRLNEGLTADLTAGALEAGIKRIQAFTKVEIGAEAYISVLENVKAIEEAFTSNSEPLITFPGDMGLFYNNVMERDGFVAYQGPEKRGKTWRLQDIAWRGMEQGRKVAFFSVGDMSRNQVMRRFMVRAARRPQKAGVVKYPISMSHDIDDDFVVVDYEQREFKHDLRWEVAQAACAAIVEQHGTDQLRLSCHPNSSISMNGIRSLITSWERSDWVPDIIIIDYADILAPMFGNENTREQVNATWKAMRRLSQELHCLVVTATQSNAVSYKVETQDQSHFSEDKRKHAHVTGMIGLNQTKSEKDQSVLRLNWIELRESEFHEGVCLYTASCLAIANPSVLACF